MWCLMRDLIMASQTESRGVEASDRRAFPRQGIDPLDDEMGFRIRANVRESANMFGAGAGCDDR